MIGDSVGWTCVAFGTFSNAQGPPQDHPRTAHS